jgi:hypothetical protein
MTARHRGWFQYEHGATSLAIHFLTSMITDISLDGVSHENDPLQSPDTLVGGGKGYPNMMAFVFDVGEEQLYVRARY